MGMQALRCCSCVHGPKSPPKQSPGVCSAGECTVPGVKGFVTGFPADFPGAVLEPVWVLNESRVFCSSSLWSCLVQAPSGAAMQAGLRYPLLVSPRCHPGAVPSRRQRVSHIMLI